VEGETTNKQSLEKYVRSGKKEGRASLKWKGVMGEEEKEEEGSLERTLGPSKSE